MAEAHQPAPSLIDDVGVALGLLVVAEQEERYVDVLANRSPAESRRSGPGKRDHRRIHLISALIRCEGNVASCHESSGIPGVGAGCAESAAGWNVIRGVQVAGSLR